MGRSYRQCIQCGKRALSIATRCPACGRELEGPVVKDNGSALKSGRFPWPKVVVAGALATAAIVAAIILARANRSREDQSSTALADSTAAYSAMAYVDTARAPVMPAREAGELLVARTWASVRQSRSRKAELEAVLLPGDTVLADSLRQGWYRVALEGQVLGYVHRSTLVPPAMPTEPMGKERP